MRDLKRLFNGAISSAKSLLHCTPAPFVMSSSTKEKFPKGPNHDTKYYLPDGNLHFKIENTVFRIHIHFFKRESPNFRQRMAGRAHATYDGLSDQTAILIENTSPEEFSDFLYVFYNEDFIYTNTPVSAWMNVLNLSSASRWDFPKVHALALKHLADLQLPIVDRIVLYKQCSVQIHHLLPLYAELCLREDPLALDESVRLGCELTNTITHVREHILRAKASDNTQASGMNPITEDPTMSQEHVIKLVKTALENTSASSSLMDLQKSQKCLTTHPSACDQSHNRPQPTLRARYKTQDTTSSLADAMLAESSNQAQNRSIPSSSKAKGKAPAVCNAQKIIKRTVAQLRIRNENSNAAAAEGVRA